MNSRSRLNGIGAGIKAFLSVYLNSRPAHVSRSQPNAEEDRVQDELTDQEIFQVRVLVATCEYHVLIRAANMAAIEISLATKLTRRL